MKHHQWMRETVESTHVEAKCILQVGPTTPTSLAPITVIMIIENDE